jgi:hypothetical protein
MATRISKPPPPVEEPLVVPGKPSAVKLVALSFGITLVLGTGIYLVARPSAAPAPQVAQPPSAPPPTATPAEVSIRFDLTPPDAVVKRNGEVVTPPLKLAKGDANQTVRVEAAGYRAVEVPVRPDADKVVAVVLEKEQPAVAPLTPVPTPPAPALTPTEPGAVVKETGKGHDKPRSAKKKPKDGKDTGLITDLGDDDSK